VTGPVLTGWPLEAQLRGQDGSDPWRGRPEDEAFLAELAEETPAAAEYAEKFHSSEPYYKGPGGIAVL